MNPLYTNIYSKIFLLQSRELELAIYWRDWRQMSAVKFLRLEDFLDNQRHGMAIHLEPQGILFAEVSLHASLILLCFGISGSPYIHICYKNRTLSYHQIFEDN